MNLFSRLSSLLHNARILAPLLGGHAKALIYLLKTRGNNASLHEGNYKAIPFRFRRGDLPALKEIFFRQEYQGLMNELTSGKDKPVICDIGAHIGLFALWVFSIRPDAEIHSIEPSPGTYKILSSNAAENKFSWRTENKAAWGKNEFISFADDSQSTMSHRVSANGNIKIPTVTMAELLPGKTIDLMKLDIEGAEESFLTAENADLGRVKNLVMELHPAYCNAEKVMEALRKNFKTIENLKDGTQSKPVLLCRK